MKFEMPRVCSLGRVEVRAGEIAIDTGVSDMPLTLQDYSRFKYGDGARARLYGAMLALRVIPVCLPALGETDVLHVTASAYKVAPPAAASLVAPFVRMAQLLAGLHGFRGEIRPFRLHRRNLTHDDYATMSLRQRNAVIRQNGLSLPEGLRLEGQSVIALDDIRVTGLHEASVDALLSQNGAARILHAYVLEVANGRHDPEIEARINHAFVRDMDDLIQMAAERDFIMNARFCRHVLSASSADIRRFAAATPPSLITRLLHNAAGDALQQMPRYRKGFQELRGARLEKLCGPSDERSCGGKNRA